MAAYHLAFGPSGYLYLTSPTTSSYDFVFRISPEGEVSEFYRGLGRPQGMAFDREEQPLRGRITRRPRGIVRITKSVKADLVISDPACLPGHREGSQDHPGDNEFGLRASLERRRPSAARLSLPAAMHPDFPRSYSHRPTRDRPYTCRRLWTQKSLPSAPKLLTPHRLDTNSLFLTEKLNALGIELRLKTIVGDDRGRLAEVLRAALGRSAIIIATGGWAPPKMT